MQVLSSPLHAGVTSFSGQVCFSLNLPYPQQGWVEHNQLAGWGTPWDCRDIQENQETSWVLCCVERFVTSEALSLWPLSWAASHFHSVWYQYCNFLWTFIHENEMESTRLAVSLSLGSQGIWTVFELHIRGASKKFMDMCTMKKTMCGFQFFLYQNKCLLI